MNGVNWGAAIRAGGLVALLFGSLFAPLGDTLLVAPAAVLVAAVLVWDTARGRRLPAGLGFVVALFVLLAVPLLWHGWGALPDYGQDKTVRLFTLTLFTAVAAYAVRGVGDLAYLARGFVTLGVVLAALAVVGPTDLAGRSIGLPGVNPLWLARAIAVGIVAAAWLAWQHLWPRLPLLVAGLLMVGGLYLTGSRGPALAAGVGVVVLAAGEVSARFLRSHVKHLAAVGAVLVAAAVMLVARSERYMALLTNPTGDDATAQRVDYWADTLGLVGEHPWGIGYGAWQDHTGSLAFYPHNVFLEVLVEGGWIVGVAFTAAAVWVLVRVLRHLRSDPASALVGALLVVETASVCLSGNINARTWFFLLALGWITATRAPRREVSSRRRSLAAAP